VESVNHRELSHQQREINGCPIHYLARSVDRAPMMVLLHCGGGSAAWLTAMADELGNDVALVVPDLSGHGSSGRRDAYEPETWAAEVADLVSHEAPAGAILVGHSMGGLVALTGAALNPELYSALVLIDAPIDHVVRRDYPETGRVYATEQDAIAAFRLRPPETVAAPDLVAAIARASVRQVPGGWTWKADGRARQRFDPQHVEQALKGVTTPVAYVYGGHSPYVDEHSVDRVRRTTGQPVPVARIDQAYHHVPLDAPAGCAAAVRSLTSALGG
jgi:pimeloyl-ACP methyl ester carboxylesterase